MFFSKKNTFQQRVQSQMLYLSKIGPVLPQPTLITIYEGFVRPHLNYRDAVSEQAFNSPFIRG